jgi:hypothetical protein
MKRLTLAAAIGLAVLLGAACDDDDDDDDSIVDPATEEADETATATEEPTPATDGEFDSADCPVDDEPFCEVAVQVANALVEGDAETIAEVSAEQEIDCEEVAVEAFPECTEGETLTGYVTSGAQGESSVRPLDDYTGLIAGLLNSVVEDASDAAGSGEMRILVVGPRADGYDMLATAILDTPDTDEGRWFFFISFDQTEDLEWLIHSFVADTGANFADAGFVDPANLLPAPEPWGSGG